MKTLSRMVEKVTQLYEQGADVLRIETYLKSWWQWVRTGVDGDLVGAEQLFFHATSLRRPHDQGLLVDLLGFGCLANWFLVVGSLPQNPKHRDGISFVFILQYRRFVVNPKWSIVINNYTRLL